MDWLNLYLAVINISAFLLFLSDKRRAVKGKKRIREATLLLVSFFGGALGGIIAMYIFRHKTKKPLFKASMPLMLIAQTALILIGIYEITA